MKKINDINNPAPANKGYEGCALVALGVLMLIVFIVVWLFAYFEQISPWWVLPPGILATVFICLGDARARNAKAK